MNHRQQLIAAILDQHDVTSQTQLVELLAEQGIAITQATVSRDLDRLGAVRVRRGGHMVYALPAEELPVDPIDRVREVLALVRRMEPSANLLVMRTAPGNAQPLARAFDVADLPEVVGDVAGDDTVLLVAREPLHRRASSSCSATTSSKGKRSMPDSIVLAYSGGLDTSVAVKLARRQLRARRSSACSSTSARAWTWTPSSRRAGKAGAAERRGHRREGRVRREVLPARAAGRRALPEPVPAGLGAVAAADRREAGAGGPRARRVRRGPRLHRQGQRPGALRGRGVRAGARPGGVRARCATGA